MRGMRRGLKAGCSSKQEISIRQKGRETKNRQMGKDNCIWGTKECQQLKGRISYPIETNFSILQVIAFILAQHIVRGIWIHSKHTKYHLNSSLNNK